MAGTSYTPKNTNRLKSIPLGSGNVYMIAYDNDHTTMPSDSDFETDANMIGRTSGGATFNYSQEFYVAKSDDGIAKKRRMTSETASFTWGIMTWIPDTVAKLLRTATATTETIGSGQSAETVAVVEGGGIGNQTEKKYWLHFVGGDDIDGKITLTGLGENVDALEAAFTNDKETVLKANFEFDPYDNSGHLYKLRMANQTTPVAQPSSSSTTTETTETTGTETTETTGTENP